MPTKLRMRFTGLFVVVISSFLLSNCSRSNPSASSAASNVIPPGNVGNWSPPTFQPYSGGRVGGGWTSGGNTMTVTVNGSQCGNPSFQYSNEPCVSVTLCSPGTTSTNCQTINNILLDTGSYGLRIFSSVVTAPLQPLTSNGYQLAECVQFGDGSSEWGPVQIANVKLGNEPATTIPVHLVNANYASAPAPCSSSESNPDLSPEQTGYNGILGVGLFTQDCGSYCVAHPDSAQYYSCNDTACAGAYVTLGAQVVNPVSQLQVDNNGVILKLPSVAAGGAASANGTLVFGIGTQANNAPPALTTLGTDANGNIRTTFTAYSPSKLDGFLDSGSSVYFFPPPNSGVLTDCGGGLAGFFCPSSSQSFTAVNQSSAGGSSISSALSIANASTLFNSGNSVFMNLGASSGTGTAALFDWGIPFFLGKNIYVGIENLSSPLGTGPYWAY